MFACSGIWMDEGRDQRIREGGDSISVGITGGFICSTLLFMPHLLYLWIKLLVLETRNSEFIDKAKP